MQRLVPDLSYAKKIINSSDLNDVIKRLVYIEGWSEKSAKAACQQYRNFLFLKLKYNKIALPPSIDIDEVWHAHILHTKAYYEFCQCVFGEYLHHQPFHSSGQHLTFQQLEEVFETQTQRLYFEENGEYLLAIKKISLLEWLSKVTLVKFFVFKLYARLNQLIVEKIKRGLINNKETLL